MTNNEDNDYLLTDMLSKIKTLSLLDFPMLEYMAAKNGRPSSISSIASISSQPRRKSSISSVSSFESADMSLDAIKGNRRLGVVFEVDGGAISMPNHF
jgi:hypothetical protein